MKAGDYVRVIANSAGHNNAGGVYQILRINGAQHTLVGLDGTPGAGWAYLADLELLTDRDELTTIYADKLNKIKESIVSSIKEVQEIKLKLDVIGRFSTVEEENAYYISRFIEEGATDDKDIAELLQKYCC